MIVTLIVVAEVAFWVLLAAGLALRYLVRMPRTGVAVLLCEPLLEVVLLIVTAMDLRNGAPPDMKHGLAAVYIGFTLTHGHYMIRWADGHFAHRFAGGPRPVKPPRYGMARAVHEWKMGARAVAGAAIAAGLLQGAVWYVGEGEQSAPLVAWQQKMGVVSAISLIIALSYTIWPKRPKRGTRADPQGQEQGQGQDQRQGRPQGRPGTHAASAGGSERAEHRSPVPAPAREGKTAPHW